MLTRDSARAAVRRTFGTAVGAAVVLAERCATVGRTLGHRLVVVHLCSLEVVERAAAATQPDGRGDRSAAQPEMPSSEVIHARPRPRGRALPSTR
jgi:hypothetical protein